MSSNLTYNTASHVAPEGRDRKATCLMKACVRRSMITVSWPPRRLVQLDQAALLFDVCNWTLTSYSSSIADADSGSRLWSWDR